MANMTDFARGFRDGRRDAKAALRCRPEGSCDAGLFGGSRPIGGCLCRACREARGAIGEYGRGYSMGYSGELHRSDLAASPCAMCNRVADAGFGPSHNGSRMCRMGVSIASGGNVAHCTCNGCF